MIHRHLLGGCVAILLCLLPFASFGQRPTTEEILIYTNRWGDLNFHAEDLLALLRCDLARWKSRPGTPQPLSFGGFSMTYDSQRGRVVLFNGTDAEGTVVVSETWEWDGEKWTLEDTDGLSRRLGAAIAYDSVRHLTTLFGGQQANAMQQPGATQADTRTWNGAAWTQLSPTTSPSARVGHAMVFDSSRGVAVLFGGDDSDFLVLTAPRLGDTWEWNGTNWTQRAPAVSPPPRFRFAMAFDSARNRTVLFGGQGENVLLGDTWEWDGTNWQQKTPMQSPSARRGHGMTYDSARERVVLFGGEVGVGFSDETWEWDGTDWTPIPATSAPTSDTWAMAYDSTHSEAVLFTGESTHVYDGLPGCSGR
ncbi:MAG: hypothetical protein GHCLOJNM_01925 [bacterium]|nr:hypothetical protein [bacterium]